MLGLMPKRVVVTNGKKPCSRCGEIKPLEVFHRHKKGVGGRTSHCIECAQRAYIQRPLTPPAMDGDRRCQQCRSLKHITEFPAHKREPQGRHGLCKECHARREKAHRLANPEQYLSLSRTTGKASELRRRYGLTKADFEELLRAQGGGCAVCGRRPDEEGQHLAVDHDGTCCGTKRGCSRCIRGLLCLGCNTGLGKFRDNPTLLRRAAIYLERRSQLGG